MSDKRYQNMENEVDVKYLRKSVRGEIDKCIYLIYRLVRFLRKKWLTVLGVFALGVGVSIYVSFKNKDRYTHEVFLVPNFGSTEYLYSFIKLVDFREFNEMNTSKIIGLEIEPVQDTYGFLLSDSDNMRAFEQLAQRGVDVEKYSNSKVFKKNNKYHKLLITTKGVGDNDKLISDLISYINEDKYFQERRKIETANAVEEIKELQKSVELINGILSNMGYDNSSANVSLNAYDNVDKLLDKKNQLLRKINYLEVSEIEKDKVVYDAIRIINKPKNVHFLIKAFIPLLFVFIYVFIAYFYSKVRKVKREYSEDDKC